MQGAVASVSLESRCAPPPHQPLDPVEVLAKLASVLEGLRSPRSMEEKFGADPGTVSTKNGTRRGSHRRRIRTATGRLHVQHILRIRNECLGVATATHETRVREDLMVLLSGHFPLNRMQGHRDDRRIPRRGQNWRIGTSACYHRSPAEVSTVFIWRREAAVLETARKRLMTPTGEGTS